jgi:hypothetical protein
VTRQLQFALEVEAVEYKRLEVSSPGLDRPLRNQRDYERQNLQFLTGIMHGVPVTAQSETLGYEAPPNPVNQLLGLGIAGNQLSGMMSSSSAPKGTP